MANKQNNPDKVVETHKIENSSTLAEAHYTSEGNLIALFKNGMEYKYLKVEPKVFEELKKAESAGKFLNREIKGKYEFQKMEDDNAT